MLCCLPVFCKLDDYALETPINDSANTKEGTDGKT